MIPNPLIITLWHTLPEDIGLLSPPSRDNDSIVHHGGLSLTK